MRVLRALLFLAAMVSWPLVAAAEKDPEGFEPINSDMMQKGESFPANQLVAGAYGFIFVGLLGYVASIAIRLRQSEQELDRLRSQVERK